MLADSVWIVSTFVIVLAIHQSSTSIDLATRSIVEWDKSRNDFRTPTSDLVRVLMNDCIEGIEFFSANITQDQRVVVGRETCPDRVAKPRLPDAGQARYHFRLSV